MPWGPSVRDDLIVVRGVLRLNSQISYRLVQNCGVKRNSLVTELGLSGWKLLRLWKHLKVDGKVVDSVQVSQKAAT